MPNTGQRLRLTANQKADIYRRYADGESTGDIAASLGCTRGAIDYHLKLLGAQKRAPGSQTEAQRAKYSGVLHPGWKHGRYTNAEIHAAHLRRLARQAMPKRRQVYVPRPRPRPAPPPPFIKHGATVGGIIGREYRIWTNMKTRCTNPNVPAYERYGGRGITICAEWMNDYARFFADMGPCPPGLQLDRVDNDGNYSPDNCRWTDRFTQARNKGKRRWRKRPSS